MLFFSIIKRKNEYIYKKDTLNFIECLSAVGIKRVIYRVLVKKVDRAVARGTLQKISNLLNKRFTVADDFELLYVISGKGEMLLEEGDSFE